MKKNIFQKAVEDLFKIDDFLDEVVIEGEVMSCFITRKEDQCIYTENGLEEVAPFEICLKLPLPRMPRQGDKVLYQGCTYKISSVETDSANASVTLHLTTMSKGV